MPRASPGQACRDGSNGHAPRMLHTADPVRHAATVLQERHELTLGLGIALDVALRHGETRIARELLHVPATAPDLRHSARRPGHKGAAPSMGRTARHL